MGTIGAEALVRKLGSTLLLTSEEQKALLALPLTIRDVAPDQDIVREGDHPHQSCVLVAGFLFRYKFAGDGRRQILSFHVPGEIPDLQSLYLRTMDHSMAAVSPSKVGFVQHSALHDLIDRFPRIGGALWRETLIDAAIFREWMVGLGRRKAPGRIAHFFCEMYVRFEQIGMAEGMTVPLPITQEELGDALGLSSVHTNRALQELRSKGSISFDRGKLTIEDWDGLAEAGEFDPSYLHLSPQKRPEPV